MLILLLQSISCLNLVFNIYTTKARIFKIYIELDVFYVLLKDLKTSSAILACKGSWNF